MLNETSWKSRLLLPFRRAGRIVKDKNLLRFRGLRRGRTAAVLAACLAFFLLTVWFTLPPTQPNFIEAQFDAIAHGMTEEEVESILGGPAGDYRGHGYAPLPEKPFDTEYARDWVGQSGSICVLFQRDTGRVAFTYYSPEPTPNWVDQVREWISRKRF